MSGRIDTNTREKMTKYVYLLKMAWWDAGLYEMLDHRTGRRIDDKNRVALRSQGKMV